MSTIFNTLESNYCSQGNAQRKKSTGCSPWKQPCNFSAQTTWILAYALQQTTGKEFTTLESVKATYLPIKIHDISRHGRRALPNRTTKNRTIALTKVLDTADQEETKQGWYMVGVLFCGSHVLDII
jgi:hypothetical protein